MKIKNYSVIIYSGLLFLFSAAAVFFIFPKQKQFAFSYTIGSPWLHEDLIAAFDFPLYKTKQQLNYEKDSIKKAFIPFFVEDTAIGNKYTQEVNSELRKISEEKFELLFEENIETPRTIIKWKRNYEKFIDELYRYVRSGYEKGVIAISDNVVDKDLYRFYLNNNGVSELSYGNEYVLNKTFNEGIYKIYEKSGIKSLDSLTGYEIKNLLNNKIAPSNIIYDESMSENILEKDLNSVSPFWGMKKEGELIVRNGTIVDEKVLLVLDSYRMQIETESPDGEIFNVSLGIALIFLSLFLVTFLYLFNFQPEILNSFKGTTFLTIQILLIISAVYLVFDNTGFSINVIPFALIPLIIVTFYNFQISLIVYFAAILIAGFFAPNSFDFVFIQTISGIVAMFSLKNTLKRSQIFITMGLVLLSYVVLATGFYLIKAGRFESKLLMELLPYAISSFLLLLYLPFVFIFEKSFGFVSGFTLMELSNTNNPALRLLSEKAPGTFQHSLQVANLVESVVIELGGNSLLARTGALYHDIGKSAHPEYFIENQSGDNVHDSLDFEESAQKIISHVVMGAELAKKYKLPAQITDFITMHHGTSLTKYFYNSWVNANPDSMPVITNFMYPGPKPQTLETAVMMMADAIEAASRTLPEYTPETIDKTVAKIIDAQLNDGQFSDVDITLKQINIAKKVFASKIKNIYHARVVYPEINKKN